LATSSGYFYVNLTWNAPATPLATINGIAGYVIYRGLSQSTLAPLATIGPITHFNDTINYFVSRTYYYFVTAILNNLGESSESSLALGRPLVTPLPSYPLPIAGDMFVNLTWTLLDQKYLDFFDIDYIIFRGLTPSFFNELARVGEKGFYNDTNIPPKPVTYYYKVAYSIRGVGVSNLTNIASGTPRTPPDPPELITLEPMDRVMNLTWIAPMLDGGYPIETYTVYRGLTPDLLKPVMAVSDISAPYFDSDIVPGANYYYSVTSSNHLGESATPDSIKGLGQTKPSPPRDVILVPEDQRIKVEWQPPEFDWGTEISDYSVYRGTSEDQLTIYKIVDGYTETITDIVSNGIPFYYSVTATNIHGESDQTETLMTIASGIPGVVLNVTAEIGDSSAQLKWEGPAHDGGLPIISYKVYRGLDIDNIDTEFTLSSGARTFKDTGLENGVTYYYRITAINMKGESARSSAVIVTPGRIPDRITQITIRGELESSILTWTNPNNLGGREGLNIQIYRGASPSSLAPYEVKSYGEVKHTDEGLRSGHIYYYGLTVINNIGEGPMSPIVSTIVYGEPLAPIIEDAFTESRSINLTWVPPENDGGLPIIKYRIDIRPEGEVEWEKVYGNEVYYEFTGLSLGSYYDLRVAAVNQLSEGAESKILRILVGETPKEPRDLKVDLIKPDVRVSWNARPQISLPVLGYRVYMKVGEGDPILWADIGSDIKQVMVKGLIKGMEYSFAVSAYNIIGEGITTQYKVIKPTSESSEVPWIWVDSVGDEFVKIIWSPPEFEGGTEITSYTLYRGAALDSDDVLATGLKKLSYVDENVINGRTYYYKVKAFNKEGGSDYSDPIMARPIGIPSAPIDFKADPSSDRITLTWSLPENTGGDPISGYLLYKGTDEESMELYSEFESNISSFVDRDVTEGTYIYRLVAVNLNGEGSEAVAEVSVPSRMSTGILVGGVGLLLPIMIILLILFLPGILKKRKEAQERKRKEAEEEELRIRRMRAEGLASRGLPGGSGRLPALNGGTADRPAMAAPMTTPHLPPTSERAPTPHDEGYIRPTEKKKAKKDKKKILRADGKSLEHRMKEEELRHSLTVKDHHKGKHWEKEKNKALEEEAKKVFTGQQIKEPEPVPAPIPSPTEILHEEKPDDDVVPTVEDVLKDIPTMGDEGMKEIPTWDEDEGEEKLPTWGEEEISMADMPKEEHPFTGISEVSEYEEIEDLEELEELEDFEE
jgi:fibronectin type 3 domain-containing protein